MTHCAAGSWLLPVNGWDPPWRHGKLSLPKPCPRTRPESNQIPFLHVSAVCHVPYGGYPTAVYRHYDYDSDYLRAYAKAAKDDEQFKTFQDKHLYGVKDHQAFLNVVGRDRLAAIKADPRTGYAVDMKRG